MKKVLLSLLAIAGLLTSCLPVENELIRINPDNAVSPTIQQISDVTLDKDAADISVSFSGIEFEVNVPKTYTLYASATEDFAKVEKVAATFGSDKFTIKQSTLNSTILNLGGLADEPFTVFFRVSGWMANDKGSAIESTLKYSNVISCAVTPYSQLILDKDVYEHVWVIGNYCGWDHSKTQFLYNYSKDGDTFTGVIDFGDKAADGFKLTGAAEWNTATGNWGSADGEESPEPETIQLLNSDGSKDIKALSKRFYNFTFKKGSLVLVPGTGFNSLGVVGSITDWGGQPDIEMTYNADFVRFWADYEFTTASEIKFRADADWGVNWGVNAVPGGDNIPVEPGKYRIYFDLNKKTIEFSTSMYGKPEPTVGGGEEEGDDGKPSKWSIAGTVGGNGWDPAAENMLLSNTEGDTWVIRSLAIAAGDEFKICADGGWTISFGGPVANAKSTIDPSNPYDVYAATIGETFEAGGTNIQITEEGIYDITLNYVAEGTSTIKVEKHVAVFSLIGEINGDTWSKDVIMTEKDGIWSSPIVSIKGGFKIRYDFSWDDANTYGFAEGTEFALDTDITLVQPGNNITVPAEGDYKVIFNPETKVVRITQPAFPENLYMIGEEFGAWDWSSDGIVEMTPVFNQDGKGEAQFWAVRYITAGKGFKFCAKREWSGDFHSLTTNDGYTEQGGNCTVDKDGLYLIHIDLKGEKVHVEPARVYGMGDCFGSWNAATDNQKLSHVGNKMVGTFVADGEIRLYVESAISTTDWWTREFIFFNGKIAYRGMGGDQERVRGTAGQKITLDFNAGTATLE